MSTPTDPTDTGARTAIVVVGSLNADLTVHTPRLPKGGETVTGGELAVLPGGKSSNQAAVAALLGGDVRLVGRVGSDAHGTLLLGRARDTGIDTSRVRALDDVATGTAVIAVDDAGENFIIVSPGANGRIAASDVADEDDTFADAAIVCLCLEIPQEAVEAAAAAGTAHGATVVLNLSPSAPVSPTLLRDVDVLLVNEHELGDLLGTPVADEPADTDWARVARDLGERGIRRAVVTLGGAGSVVLDGTAVTRVDATPITAVDTTGSGDAFTGSLALRLAAGDDLATAARFASRVGAFAATRRGAQSSYPTADEFAAWGPDH